MAEIPKAFFKSIKIGRDAIKFTDAGFGYNNPCEVLIEEARRLYPDRNQMRVLSIGTGLGAAVTIKDSLKSIIKALGNMATSSQKVAERLNVRFSDSGHYCRLNVSKGLEDVTISD
ncbi:hypothetical protein F4677DRAFT_413095 [Hypoxylon crocopeplum]|nr:hypothetical protein F4677DRAFT_413095 [Hypoxylon crocopeplum]